MLTDMLAGAHRDHQNAAKLAQECRVHSLNAVHLNLGSLDVSLL